MDLERDWKKKEEKLCNEDRRKQFLIASDKLICDCDFQSR